MKTVESKLLNSSGMLDRDPPFVAEGWNPLPTLVRESKCLYVASHCLSGQALCECCCVSGSKAVGLWVH